MGAIRKSSVSQAVTRRVPRMTDEKNWLDLFREREALLEGHFLLSSGRHSSRYLQCARLLMDPPLATRIGAAVAERVRATLGETSIDAVVGPAMGAVIVAHEVARGLGCRGLFAERADGEMLLRRGFTLTPGERVVIVEDVVTTGRSTREVCDAVAGAGAKLEAVASIVDRSEGSVSFDAPLVSLVRLDVPTFAADDCALCAEGGAPVKPGSRS